VSDGTAMFTSEVKVIYFWLNSPKIVSTFKSIIGKSSKAVLIQ